MLWRFNVIINIYRQIITPTFSLFTSLSTLICCALPIFFVTLGMGASLASLISAFPWITIISKFKVYLFVGAGLVLLFSIILFLLERKLPCPTDIKQAKICSKLRFINLIILITSSIIYFIGFFFAFLAEFFF